MFFTDSTGFFALVCLMIQCVLAWIFAAFLGVLAPGRAAWLYSLFVAFLGLGIGLTSLSVRFTLAHHAFAGEHPLQEGGPVVHTFYGLYFAGKVMFVWGVVRGVSRWRGRRFDVSSALPATLVAVGFAIGFALPTIEAVLLLQAPFITVATFCCARWLRDRAGEAPDLGRRTVRVVMYAMAALWLLYAVAAISAGLGAPQQGQPLGWILRINSLIDLALQVVLAAGVIVAVMAEAQGRIVAAQDERDRLQRQVERDDKLRAMATMASGVAHEINNPLTSILGFAGDLGSADPDERRRAAEIVREQAERCRHIVQRVSRLGSGRVVLTSELDVAEVLRRVVRGMRPQVDAAGAAVSVQCEPGIVLNADAAGFEQVVSNLVTNALHVTKAGGEVRVRAEALLDGLQLTVDDCGPGVREGDRRHVFEPFWTTKHGERGSGLGLAVVDAIVHAHGGAIEVGDAVGGGASFCVQWPWRPPSGSDTPTPEPHERRVDGASLGRAPDGARLLIVDDEELVRATLRRQAEARGWQVVEAESAERALVLLTERYGRFAAIVCDLRMPGMSGIELHDELMRRDASLLQRTLFLTGDLASSDASEFAIRCRAPIVSKPFVADELFARIGEIARAQAG